MYVITYSLKDNETNSDRYYQDIAIFTNDVLSEIENLTHNIVSKYSSYLKEIGVDELYSKEEYGFELLLLGTFWQVYSGDANGLGEVPRQLLTELAKLRKLGGGLKPGIDFVRGIMATLFLSPDLYDNLYILDPSLGHLEKLITWLLATGEFDQEVKRLKKWQEYLATISLKESIDVIATTITLAAWFELSSEEAIGKYTLNVERYLNELRQDHYWHEDVIFCGRRRVEYHLNMVGAEIMNRAFRVKFLNTSKKLILIPACMRILPTSRCKAVNSEKGLFCMGCTSECSVNRLTKLGKECGFNVMIVPHESSISAIGNSNPFTISDTGVIGVACTINLISGGWMLQDMKIPAQCVLLDYCGCKKHWSKEGIPTEININQLKRILGIENINKKVPV
jgi:uncharacterized protein